MEDLEIRNPEDWYRVQNKLRKMCKPFPEFVFDYNKIVRNIGDQIKELSEIDIKIRRSKSNYYLQLREEKIKQININIKTFSKILMICVLKGK